MGKASRGKQERRARRRPPEAPADVAGDPQELGERALDRLVRSNEPGKFSLAGAYAFGYAELAMAQVHEDEDEDEPVWYDECDALDTLFLGTIWPARFPDEFEFANARDAWLRLLRGTVHGRAIERFVHEAVELSAELELPVDHGQLLLALTGRLEAAGLDRRRLPRRLLPGTALQDHRAVFGPSPDFPFPEPPEDAKKQVKRFWKMTEEKARAGDTPKAVLRVGLNRVQEAGMPARTESWVLLAALYLALMAKPGELLDDAGKHAEAWALSVDEASPLAQVLDVLLVAPQREMSTDDVLAHLFAIPAFTEPIPSEALLWTSSPGLALPRLAFEMGFPEVSTLMKTLTPDMLDWAGMHTRMRLSAADHGNVTDDTDAAQEESDEQWDERQEAVREAVLNKVRKSSGGADAVASLSGHPVERIWNADGSSVIRFSTDSPQGKQFKKAMKYQQKMFRKKFGRDPGPDDPLFFDLEADEPVPLTKKHFDNMMLEMAGHAAEMGYDPAFFHACREVGYMVTSDSRHMFTTAEVIAFRRAMVRHQEADA